MRLGSSGAPEPCGRQASSSEGDAPSKDSACGSVEIGAACAPCDPQGDAGAGAAQRNSAALGAARAVAKASPKAPRGSRTTPWRSSMPAVERGPECPLRGLPGRARGLPQGFRGDTDGDSASLQRQIRSASGVPGSDVAMAQEGRRQGARGARKSNGNRAQEPRGRVASGPAFVTKCARGRTADKTQCVHEERTVADVSASSSVCMGSGMVGCGRRMLAFIHPGGCHSGASA